MNNLPPELTKSLKMKVGESFAAQAVVLKQKGEDAKSRAKLRRIASAIGIKISRPT